MHKYIQRSGWQPNHKATDGILSAIGNTPLVRLKRLFTSQSMRLYAKLEALNPGGSIKDRPAFYIIEQAMKAGKIQSDTVVIESSSGNMGIGLAQACSCFGVRFICVVDPKATTQNLRLLAAYGAEVQLVEEPDALTGEYLNARINLVQELLRSIKNSFWPNQYANEQNSIAHFQTMNEIVSKLNGEVDYLFCATSTCGTLRGCAEFVKNNGLSTRIIAVDAVGSVIFGGVRGKRLLPGHGAAVRPELYSSELADQVVLVSDLDCVVGCRKLCKREGLLAGGSSGAVISAVEQMKSRIPFDSVCVVILADRGERYLDTIYSDNWVHEHFGNVNHLWERKGSHAYQ